MTETMGGLPLSPGREWAIARSFISGLHRLDGWGNRRAREERRDDRDDLPGRLPGSAAAGGAIGVQGFDLVTDQHRFLQRVRSRHDPRADLVRFCTSTGERRAVYRIESDEIAAELGDLHAGQPESLLADRQREAAACHRAGAGVRDLPLADVAVHVSDRDLETVGAWASGASEDAHAIESLLRH